jgi:hypothetical protein
MGNLTSLAMGLAAQEEAVSVVSDVEEGVGEEQQEEVTEVVSEEGGGTGDEEQEGRGGKVDDEGEEQNELALLQNTFVVSAGKVSLISALQVDTIYTI